MTHRDLEPSITLLLPYVGRFPNYFGLFLTSCAANRNVRWLILSPEPVPYPLPANVERRTFSIPELERRIQQTLGINPDIRRPYKICDFRPAYGMLFPDHLAGSDFWGHCDADMVFGNIRKFITPEILESHVKVQMRGAFSLYKNDSVGNTLFTLPDKDVDYRTVYSDHRYWGFDEWQGIYRIVQNHSIPFYQGNFVAEIKPNYFDLRLSDHRNYTPQTFLWKNGRVVRQHWSGGELAEDEFAYMHLQKRRYTRVEVTEPADGFYILPDSFVPASASDGSPEWAARNNCRRRGYEVAQQVGRIPAFLRRIRTTKRFTTNRIRRSR